MPPTRVTCFRASLGVAVLFRLAHFLSLPSLVTYDGRGYLGLPGVLSSQRFPQDSLGSRTPFFPSALKANFYPFGRQSLAAILVPSTMALLGAIVLADAIRRSVVFRRLHGLTKTYDLILPAATIIILVGLIAAVRLSSTDLVAFCSISLFYLALQAVRLVTTDRFMVLIDPVPLANLFVLLLLIKKRCDWISKIMNRGSLPESSKDSCQEDKDDIDAGAVNPTTLIQSIEPLRLLAACFWRAGQKE